MNQETRIAPTHPGVDLLELLESHRLTQYRLAKELGVPQTRIMQIIKGRRSISADTALRLARFFGTSKEYWLNRQMNYDLELAQMKIGQRIEQQVTPLASEG
jgi:addiction module HigA family antidote